MKILKVVAAVMHVGDYYYIFRRPDDKSFGGHWEFPGGKIEQGETSAEALIREIKEELDLNIVPGKLIINTSYETRNLVINISFYDVLLKEHISPSLNEHSEMKMISKNDISNINWAPADIESLAYIFK